MIKCQCQIPEGVKQMQKQLIKKRMHYKLKVHKLRELKVHYMNRMKGLKTMATIELQVYSCILLLFCVLLKHFYILLLYV